jgi:hypothetical protein
MKKTLGLALALGLVAGMLGAVPSSARLANHNEDDHSDNFKQKSLTPIVIDKELHAQGTDLAFKGKLVIAGSYQGTGIFKI